MKNKNKNWIVIISISILVLLLLAVIVVIWIKKDKPLSTKAQFNNISNKSSDIGGLLIHMMGISDMETSMKNDKFGLSLMTDCASTNRKTCSAWTLVRKDLPPMVFIYPMIGTPTVGIIINAKSAWDLVTTMGNIDSNTNCRNCCQQEYGVPMITRYPNESVGECMTKMLGNRGFDIGNKKYNGYLVYIPSKNHDGQMCPPSCAHDDLFCKYNSAGASINIWDWFKWDECSEKSFIDCYDFKVQDATDIPLDLYNIVKDMSVKPVGYIVQSTSKDCNVCKRPYLCVTESPPTAKSDNYPVMEKDRFAAYVGEDGLGWNKLFTTPINKIDPDLIVNRQCKWEKKDMQQWINSLKKYYSDIYSKINPNDNYMDPNFNYFLANPDHACYLENEINIYVNSDTSSGNYIDQNAIFMNSIEGFFYIPTTCEDQLKVLNGIPTTEGNHVTYTTAVDRCDGFFKQIVGDDRREYENKQVSSSKSTVIEFTKWFNNKYDKNVSVYSADLGSNSFPNSTNMKLAQENNIDFDKIFTKI
jgi:hypothetical protein